MSERLGDVVERVERLRRARAQDGLLPGWAATTLERDIDTLLADRERLRKLILDWDDNMRPNPDSSFRAELKAEARAIREEQVP